MEKGRMRIVVTGMGLVSPLGCGVEHVWPRLIDGASGVRRLPKDLAPDVACQVAAPVLDRDELGGFYPKAILAAKDLRKMDRFIQLAMVATEEAIVQSGWAPASDAESCRTATIIATGIGGFDTLASAVRTTDNKGARRLSPFTIPSFLANLAAGHVSIRYGFKGPIGTPVTACAAGVQAIGDAARLIHSGEVDVAICGGAESAIHHVSLGGFGAAKALSSAFNDTPEAASRPFDTQRDGFVMGEGAGILIIESLDHALRRGAMPIAEITGYGTTADAWHITAGPDDGDGAARAMRLALAQANLAPDQIGHLNAHATSTPVGDRGELAAIRSVFGTNGTLAISATKSATGHTLGAAGGIEAIFTIMALRQQVLPPTLNLVEPDPLADGLDLVGPQARNWKFDHAISNGFGFGGVNASLVVSQWRVE